MGWGGGVLLLRSQKPRLCNCGCDMIKTLPYSKAIFKAFGGTSVKINPVLENIIFKSRQYILTISLLSSLWEGMVLRLNNFDIPWHSNVCAKYDWNWPRSQCTRISIFYPFIYCFKKGLTLLYFDTFGSPLPDEDALC